jgi:anti-sigma factor RsiW
MTNHDHFDDELLSAYVDGELTAAERAQVEERLRTDPQAAQLVEELRSLSRAIKAMPRQPLGRDLWPGIKAELNAEHADGKTRHLIPLSEPLDPPRGFRRGFFWSTIAIAAALLLMFTEAADEEAQRDLAAAKARQAPERIVEPNREDVAGLRKELPAMGQMRAAPSPEESEADAAKSDRVSAAAAPSAAGPPADSPEQELALGGGLSDEAKLAATPSDPAAASTPAEPMGSADDATISTVEVAVAATDAVEQFDRVLRDNGVVPQIPSTQHLSFGRQRALQLNSELEGETQYGFSKQRSETTTDGTTSEKTKLAAGPEVRRLMERAGTADDPVGVLVEGTPAQIRQILEACAAQSDIFPQVVAAKRFGLKNADALAKDDATARVAGDRVDARAGGRSSSVVGEGAAIGGAAAGIGGGAEESLGLLQGRAWYFRLNERAEHTDEFKAADKQLAGSRLNTQAGTRFEAPAGAAATSAAEQAADLAERTEAAPAQGPAASGGQTEMSRDSQATPDELEPTKAGQVRVLFLLRREPPADPAGEKAADGTKGNE